MSHFSILFFSCHFQSDVVFFEKIILDIYLKSNNMVDGISVQNKTVRTFRPDPVKVERGVFF